MCSSNFTDGIWAVCLEQLLYHTHCIDLVPFNDASGPSRGRAVSMHHVYSCLSGREITVGKESFLEQTLPDSNPSDLLRHLVIKSECILRDYNMRELTVGKNNHLCIIIIHKYIPSEQYKDDMLATMLQLLSSELKVVSIVRSSLAYDNFGYSFYQ